MSSLEETAERLLSIRDELLSAISPVVKAVKLLIQENAALAKSNQELKDRLSSVLHSIDLLVAESDGVKGLHKNGRLVDWDSLMPGGMCAGWLGVAYEKASELIKHKKEESNG